MCKNKNKFFIIPCIFAVITLLLYIPQLQNMLVNFLLGRMDTWATHNYVTDIDVDYSITSKRLAFFIPISLFILFLLIGYITLPTSINSLIKVHKKNISMLNINDYQVQYKYIFIVTAILFLITHGYCYFNSLYSHDSLLIYQTDTFWQISLGRFLQPFLCLFRGRIATPFVIGVFSYIYISISICLIINLFEIRNNKIIFLIISLMVTSFALTLTNATYIFESDLYMLSLVLSVIGTYYILKNKKFSWIAIICFTLSTCLYQAYLQVPITICLFFMMIELLDNRDAKQVVMLGLKFLACLIVSLVFYFILFKLIMFIFAIQKSDTYNGLDNVLAYSSIWMLIKDFLRTYLNLAQAVLKPHTFNPLVITFVNVSLIIFFIIFLIKQCKKNKVKKTNVIWILVILAILPFGVNFVCFVSHGLSHDLMKYSITVCYVMFFIMIINSSFQYIKILVTILLSIITFNGVVYSNQVYLKKDLEAQSTLSLMTRILDRIELIDEFEPGITPIAFIGEIGNSNLKSTRLGFDYNGTGLESSFSITYSVGQYMKEVLGYPNPTLIEKNEKSFDNIKPFPSKDSCFYENGVVYVKLGDIPIEDDTKQEGKMTRLKNRIKSIFHL